MRGLLAWLRQNILLAVVVFAASFLLPFLITVFIGMNSDNLKDLDPTSKSEKVFPGSLQVNDQGVAYKVPNNPDYGLSNDEDLLFVVWFKLRKAIQLGERIIIVGKYEAEAKARPGYSLGLAKDADGVRPILYWQSPDAPGKWYSFSPANIDAKEWNYLAFSFRNLRYLGVHLGTLGKNGKPELLGGYDLEADILAKSSAPLVVGAFGGSKFRGRIGPFGVIRAKDLTSHLTNLLSEFLEKPGELPTRISGSAIKLWVKDGVDISSYKNPVTVTDLKSDPNNTEE